MTLTATRPTPSAEDRFAVLADPPPGTVVELAPGSHLAVRFRRRLGPSRWYVTGLPGHLLALATSGHEFQFLVFGCPGDAVPLRLERRHPDGEDAHEVCEVVVVAVDPPVSGGGRTSRSASPRTASR